jgi:glycosyltransferase involved in cell wall biosynthesis
MTDRKLSLCLTNYNRDKMLLESFNQVLNDDRVSEIVIVDDVSDLKIYELLVARYAHIQFRDKVKLFRNERNLGCYLNKSVAISKASNEFVIIFDSDNTMTTEYIDRIFEQEWKRDTILAPEFARPHFDYRTFSGEIINKGNVRGMVDRKHFTALINTMNYFVHRDEYLKVFDSEIEPWTADTAYQNYNWLKAGNSFHVLKGLQYDHLVHNGSHYQEHNKKTGNFFNEVMDKMRRLR